MHIRIDSFKKLRDNATSKDQNMPVQQRNNYRLMMCNTATIETRFNEQFHTIDSVSSVNDHSAPSK